MMDDGLADRPKSLSDGLGAFEDRHPKFAGAPLEYPWNTEVPDFGSLIEVASGIFWTRLPLPWALDHINVYIIDDGDGWTIIDTGIDGAQTQKCWQLIAETICAEKPIKRVICTHFHHDHAGSAGWLCDLHGAPLWMSETEYLYAKTVSLEKEPESYGSMVSFLIKAGLQVDDPEKAKIMAVDMMSGGIGPIPQSYIRLMDGSEFEMGGRTWRVITGRGHSPEHACLECLDEPILISGDQVIAEISSIVGVYGDQPLANPLALWLESLDRLRAAHPDALVLPSHKRPFKGLHRRLQDLTDDHSSKLQKIAGFCGGDQKTALQIIKPLFGRTLQPFDLILALSETVAHIHLLVELGVLSRIEEDNVWQFETVADFEPDRLIKDVLDLPGVKSRNVCALRD